MDNDDTYPEKVVSGSYYVDVVATDAIRTTYGRRFVYVLQDADGQIVGLFLTRAQSDGVAFRLDLANTVIRAVQKEQRAIEDADTQELPPMRKAPITKPNRNRLDQN